MTVSLCHALYSNRGTGDDDHGKTDLVRSTGGRRGLAETAPMTGFH
jgi:hypothetical protein